MPIIFQPECGPKCRSKQHCLEINSVITKGSLPDLQAYSLLCHTWAQHTDTVGRSALHVAASCGKLDMVEWLVGEKHQDPSSKDKESGWTALHRSLFYGQLSSARLLVQFNADLYSRDHEGLSPLDILVKDRPQHLSFDTKDANEVYSWGDNSNLTLGHASEQRRTVPEAVDTFRRLGVSVKQIVMSKYHTVFLGQSGLVYTCGHGHGGRLGHVDESTCVMPKLVEALEKEECLQVAAARDHTLFLTARNAVYCCGLNDFHQLGVPATGDKGITKYLVPTKMNLKVLKGKAILGVCAGRYHSVIYTADGLYTCGLNAGQLGHLKAGEKYQSQVRMVTQLAHKDTVISKVSSSDAAIVCITGRGDIFLLHDYTFRKIGARWLDIYKILVCGGNLDHNADCDILREKGGFEVKVVLLNNTGKLCMWRSSNPILKRCHFAMRRQVLVKDVGLNLGGLIIVTDQGEAFTGYHSGKKPANIHKDAGKESANQESEFGKMSLLDLMLKDETEEISLRRIPCVHRATILGCDLKGQNFAVTQAVPNGWLTDVPGVSESTIHTEYQQLMEEADLFDVIHDCVVQVENHKWAAHMFILASRADYFRKQVPGLAPEPDDEGEKPVIVVSDIQPDVMEQLLKFIYTDTCDLFNIGSKFSFSHPGKKNIHDSSDTTAEVDLIFDGKTLSAFEVAQTGRKADREKDINGGDEKGSRHKGKDPVKVLQEAARKFGVKGLSKRLEAVKCVKGIVQSSGKKLPHSRIRYERTKLGELYDVCIRAEDKTTFQCHKCVLAARLEYFHSMLGSGWIETSDTESLSLPIPGDILKVLLDYVYQDESTCVAESQDLELVCNVLVVADQLLVTRLKEMCEVALTSQMTLRNVGELLEMAMAYNAQQLRQACHQFIFLNLPALLESRNLDIISDHAMQDLTDSYKQAVGRMSSRVITPWSDGPDAEFLSSLTAEFDAELTPKSRDASTKKIKVKRRQGRSKSASEEAPFSSGTGHGAQTLSLLAGRQISVGSDVSTRSEDDADLQILESKSTSICQQSDKSILIQKGQSRRLLSFSASLDNDMQQTERSQQQSDAALKGSAVTTMPIQIPLDGNVPKHLTYGALAPKQNTAGTAAPAEAPAAGISLRNIMQEEQDSTKMVKPKSVGKFSWKEAKKQQNKAAQLQKVAGQEHQSNEPATPMSATPSAPSTPGACPWGSVNKVVQSFRDLMLQDKSSQSVLSQQKQPPTQPRSQLAARPTSSPQKSAQSCQASGSWTSVLQNQSMSKPCAASQYKKSPPVTPTSFSWGLPMRVSSQPQPIPAPTLTPTLPPTSPTPSPAASDNPWLRWAATSSPPGGACPSLSFSDIVQDQLHEEVSMERASQKPLHLIQMEEEAISQLIRHYGARVCTDEHITVERVSGPVAAPLWKLKRNTASSHM